MKIEFKVKGLLNITDIEKVVDDDGEFKYIIKYVKEVSVLDL